mmetsp:Transcript_94676/g.294854  ORF Transcript_94676/g.294854 Transcript_94676/m.294854 type:complete len:261 (-) Transcript_94676:13-795(-)
MLGNPVVHPREERGHAKELGAIHSNLQVLRALHKLPAVEEAQQPCQLPTRPAHGHRGPAGARRRALRPAAAQHRGEVARAAAQQGWPAARQLLEGETPLQGSLLVGPEDVRGEAAPGPLGQAPRCHAALERAHVPQAPEPAEPHDAGAQAATVGEQFWVHSFAVDPSQEGAEHNQVLGHFQDVILGQQRAPRAKEPGMALKWAAVARRENHRRHAIRHIVPVTPRCGAERRQRCCQRHGYAGRTSRADMQYLPPTACCPW